MHEQLGSGLGSRGNSDEWICRTKSSLAVVPARLTLREGLGPWLAGRASLHLSSDVTVLLQSDACVGYTRGLELDIASCAREAGHDEGARRQMAAGERWDQCQFSAHRVLSSAALTSPLAHSSSRPKTRQWFPAVEITV